MREIALNHEEHWFELYGNVAVTGEPKRFEYPAAELNRWYEGYAFRIGQAHERRVGIVFNDITERKQTEERLRQLTRELEFKVAERTEELMQTRQRVDVLTSQLFRHRTLGGSA
jgi:two-component system, sensor histidine kinase PdtaS